jgi:hypothetical protein
MSITAGRSLGSAGGEMVDTCRRTVCSAAAHGKSGTGIRQQVGNMRQGMRAAGDKACCC